MIAMACLLLAVLAGFLVYARYPFRHIEKDLPARLGIDVQQTANSYTYSQSSQGHTLYTIHASKLVQFKAGHAQLQDVAITLYGPSGSGRVDRIYGKSFNYDQNAAIVTADGEVDIDLSGPAAQSTPAQNPANQTPAQPAPSVSSDEAQPDKSTIHIRTTGLTFNQKTGDADTSQAVEFQLPRAAGASVGASYNSKTGIVVLNNQVVLTSSSNGHSSVVHATHATLLRQTKQALLVQATSEYETEKSSSDQAVVWFRQDGSAEKIDASGHVRIMTDNGAVVTSQTAHIQLDTKSQPTIAQMEGGIVFDSENQPGENGGVKEKDETMHGTASEGTLNFGPNSLLKHAEFRDAVDFTDHQTALRVDAGSTATRRLRAAKVDVDFVPASVGKKSIARTLLATGHPVATLQQTSPKGAPQSTAISGDQLVATLDGGRSLRQIDGTGHTRLVNQAQDGSVNTSTGDTLHMTFVQPPPAVARSKNDPNKDNRTSASNSAPSQPGPSQSNPVQSGAGQSTAQIETAIQDGNVVMKQTPAKKAGATAQPATTTAWASHAEYHDADQILHLTGSPRIDDGQSLQLTSRLIDYHRDSGDMEAHGDVKATYLQPPQNGQSKTAATVSAQPAMLPGGSGPVHVLADRADLHHDSGIGYFYGVPHTPARMWQSEDSVWAPVIELHRDDSTLKAYGQGTGAAPVVNTNFTSAMGAKHQQSVFRIHSATLLYSDKARQGDFDGSVIAEDADGTIHSDHAVVYLKPAEKPGEKPNPPVAKPQPGQQNSGKQSQIDHLIATGHVVLVQPGRKGEGECLLYTAADGKYVLTGTPDVLPYLTDRIHGTTTGIALLFNSQDDSVEVSGGKSGAVTDTRAKK
jgi:lipopolysaccharide export system protein LptA